MQIVVKKPGEYPDLKEIREGDNAALDDLQEIVGGYVELVHVLGDDLVLIVNEDGKCRGLQENIVLADRTGRVVDFCVGTVAVVGMETDAEGEIVFGSVPKGRIAWVKNWLDVRSI